ncbi:C40 family peptidase [Paraburkholderia rhizosphaerae]|uniref:C40 family peptidase n=1 Tax=Paraburkholderia rhizosphaerae TaxID=480658 RepID=UPI001FBB530F|nr:C40 family peptidase [Paraburkholderia rhizosphaerae]
MGYVSPGFLAPGLTPVLRLLTLLLAVLLAACSSAPQRSVRNSSSPATTGAYRTPPGFPDFVDHSVGREEISIQAMSLVGVPYRWGGNTPDSGFDCSGLVHYVVQRAASVNLPRTTADMSSRGTSIEPDEIAAGDLVFFNTTGRPHSHVGIYVGKLRFVNAPSTGGTVRLDYLTNPYWAKRFDGIRRVAPPLAPSKPTPFDGPTYEASAPPAGSDSVTVSPAAPAATAQIPANGQAVSTVGPLRNDRASVFSSPALPDAFEPPPPTMNAAQAQARAAAQAPDPIDAAADAYEPPPPAAVAVLQAQRPQQMPQVQRTSGGGRPITRSPQTSKATFRADQTDDDPIANFANQGY